jgi:hypothetical protein
VKQLTEGHVEWTMPAPLWPQTGDPTVQDNRVRFRTPVLLRFATDTFMDDFLNLLNTQPERLSEFIAMPEQWDKPPGEPAPPVTKSGMMLTLFRARSAAVKRLQAKGVRVIGESSSPSVDAAKKGVKLYQAAHQRFYLVTACLVCRVLGLPDRKIDAGAQEKATFVIRMLQKGANADLKNPDPKDCTELALVNGAWQQAADPETLIDGEEQRPLFPAAFRQDDARRRRLLAGLVPVADRERLLQAAHIAPGSSGGDDKFMDPRRMLLRTRVTCPMKTMEDSATAAYTLATTPAPDPSKGLSNADKDSIISRTNDQLQLVSWYVLLDLAKFFEANLDELWQEIKNQGNGHNLLPASKAIWDTLAQTYFGPTTLLSAVWQAYQAESILDTVITPYSTQAGGSTSEWPGFAFRFYSASLTGAQQLSPPLDRKSFEASIVDALPAQNPHPPMPVRTISQAHANSQDPVWFAIRCVLERPNCGSLTPPFLSEPTVAFQMAAFFDPDAPARPIRIGMPVDTTPAGLRKFDKNTAFVMSDTLCGQVGKMSSKGLIDLIMSVLPFPLHKDLDGGSSACAGGGMVCSFSIPIITICALILLIIFVKLLDIVFFWMPFFQICLPLPNFNAKGSQ